MELLSPAGTPEALDAAIASGADAVYLGLKSFNARLRSTNFAYSQFEALVRVLHKQNRKIYVTVNTVFEEREADRMYQLLKYLASIGPDALIVQDYGVIEMARRYFPSLKLHASTQMNIASARGANFLSKHGVSRVVLARELTLEDLKAIRANTNSELEVFVHGALCVSVSGLCLFSSYLGGKSANRGMCTQACRRLYRTGDSPDDPSEHGYFFSPRDLQLIDRLPLLYDAGINALKIEGRMKSAEYVGTVTRAYRLVIDACASGTESSIEEAVAEAQNILRGDYARSKTHFHFDGDRSGGDEANGAGADLELDFIDAKEDGGTGIRLGVIRKKRGSGEETAVFIQAQSASIAIGDSLRFHRSDDSRRATHKAAFAEREKGGVWVSAPEGFDTGDTVYLIQRKAASRRYPQLLPKTLDKFRKTPGREKAPDIELDAASKKAATQFPAGLYVAVENAADLYVAQSVKTAAVILPFKEKNITALTAKQATPLPYSPAQIIISMPSYYPESQAEAAKDGIRRLVDKGYTRFIVNNPGQITPLKQANAALVAGPSLYAFNRHAAAFLQNAGFSFFVSPYENARQNLEKIYGGKPGDSANERDATARVKALRASVFLTLYVQPKLFQIAGNLVAGNPNGGGLGVFYDKEGTAFRLLEDGAARNGMSYAVPETPFSITDKVPFLKTAGWNRFILDFTPQPLKKVHYKTVMQAATQGTVLPCTRFNWKDGFYQAKN
ncbi:MAG: U32 family peptidase [Spirochaetaceae bacterium]|jgi:putative protease|nr:U32 family peptidase [Spirochaetaceae bacterium]